jgi:hypothetical protein
MTRLRLATIAATALAAVLLRPIPSILGEELRSQQVRQAIDRAIAYLRERQLPDGSWGEWAGQSGGIALSQPGGVTALCTLALLNAGVDPQDPQIQRVLNRQLRPRHFQTTYVVALQTMVLCKAQPDKDRSQILQNVKWLVDHQIIAGPCFGAWSYPLGSGESGDNSNSQFALLALHEAERAGIPVADKTWRLAKVYWEDCQNADGSWGYPHRAPGTGSMTCAGITSMIIVNDRISARDAQVVGDRIDCCGRVEGDADDRVERGAQWLAHNFSVSSNPNSSLWLLYYLYGLERVGRMTAQRFIGGHDWYREGAASLINSQDPLAGSFRGVGHSEDDPEIATSLALLFLSKGRRPILLAKLKHTHTDDWNRHRADVNNLARYVESRWKRDLNWQIVDLAKVAVEDLVQTPVLYYCGSLSPLPAGPAEQDALAKKLRDYVDGGGFIFAEGYCGGSGFDDGFRRLMQRVFPEPEYRLHLLPPEHPVWFAEEQVEPAQARPLWGIEYGCRTSVIYVPPDPPDRPQPSLSCLWELSRPGRGEKYSPAVEARIKAGLSIGINVLAYATNRELKENDPFTRVEPEAPHDPMDRGKFYIAKLRHPGGCNAAPRALTNLLEAAGKELHLRVKSQQRLLNITDDALFNYPLVYMQGRSSFSLNEAQHKRLREYLQRGGILFADSICSSLAFTESFRREMAAIFPHQPLRPIPANDPLWTKTYGGFDLPLVRRRDPQARLAGEPLKAAERLVPPALEGVTLGKRYAVIFSSYDLSCALEKQDSLECQGYVRDDAARIGLNVILYALFE